MKNTIFYFSGTGNSLYIAKKISAKLDGNAEIIPITKPIENKQAVNADTIGIIFPVYIYKPPHIVLSFLKKIKKELNSKYIYTIINSGGSPATSLKEVRKILGKSLKAGFTIKMPSNYLPFNTSDSSNENNDIFEEADKKITQIAEFIKQEKSIYEPIRNYFKTFIHPGILFKLAHTMIPKMDKGFWLNNSCNGCGVCQKNCPVSNIEIIDNKPQWNHNCEQCFLCINWCPKKAIEYGKNTVNKERYQNPDIRLAELNK